MATDSVQEAVQHRHAHAGSARAGGRHVTAPLIRLRVIPDRKQKYNLVIPANDKTRSDFPQYAVFLVFFEGGGEGVLFLKDGHTNVVAN